MTLDDELRQAREALDRIDREEQQRLAEQAMSERRETKRRLLAGGLIPVCRCSECLTAILQLRERNRWHCEGMLK